MISIVRKKDLLLFSRRLLDSRCMFALNQSRFFALLRMTGKRLSGALNGPRDDTPGRIYPMGYHHRNLQFLDTVSGGTL